MARFGQSFLASLTQPSYGQGLFELGGAIGGTPAAAAEKKAKQEQQQQTQAIMQEIANDPQRAQQEYLKRLAAGDPSAQAFGELAKQAATSEQARQTKGIQGALTYVTQAAARGVPIEQLSDAMNSIIKLGGTQQQVFDAYNTGTEMFKGQTTQVSRGASLVRQMPNGTVDVLYTAPDAPEKATNFAFELAETGKYTPESIQDSIQADGTINYSLLKPMTPKEKIGGLSAPAERRLEKMSEEATKATIALGRNKALTTEIAAQGGKTAGIASIIRTTALDAAGLRDAEEEAKTQFLRTRNTDIINSLPPGVASDTDVAIFSRGFPSENASSEEITNYLAAEATILAAKSDMALLADRHLQEQRTSGQDATFVGFEDKKQKYGQMMQLLADTIQKRVDKGEDPTTVEREEVALISAALGFTPKFYR